MKLIDKDVLVAEIKKRLEELNPKKGEFMGRPLRSVNPKTFPRESELEKLLLFLDTLEVKEVDLDEEADNYWETLTSDVRNSIYFNDFYKIAKYFFSLGMQVSNKAQKGEEV